MTPLALGIQFLDVLFSGVELQRLRPILAADFRFRGPMYRFESAEAYIAELEASPPVGFGFEVISSFERDSSAGVFYEFTKQGLAWTSPFTTPMAQYFETTGDVISSTLLIFDRKEFDEAKALAQPSAS